MFFRMCLIPPFLLNRLIGKMVGSAFEGLQDVGVELASKKLYDLD